MSTKSKIEWTEKTWNPVAGCTKVAGSPGCDNCYAIRLARRHDRPGTVYAGTTKPGPDWSGVVKVLPDRLTDPLRWRKPAVVFVNSMSDLWHVDVPRDFIVQVFAAMALTPQHTYQILTKRPGRMHGLLASSDFEGDVAAAVDQLGVARGWDEWPDFGWPLPNVWLGVSVEDQHHADARIPELLRTRAAVRFLSCEPLLGPLDLTRLSRAPSRDEKNFDGDGPLDAITTNVLRGGRWRVDGLEQTRPSVSWVIVGGESGPGARPFDVDWARSIVRHCREAHVPVFVKQLGANIRDRNDAGFEGNDGDAWDFGSYDPIDFIEHNPNGWLEEYQGAPVRIRLRDRKGGDMGEWPADLRVREMPGRYAGVAGACSSCGTGAIFPQRSDPCPACREAVSS